jgi:crotonobetainyl-CoA:carnitine CoA-transferase CaiB-like acyl-CoA transferase
MQVLKNTKVVSLATNLPGPLAVARLRDLGAAVRKVEPPGGDLLQRADPEWYRSLHEGITVERLDLKDLTGRTRIDTYLHEANLLVTSSRPSSLERLGLGWDDLHRRFERLAQVAIVGSPAPNEDLPGHDLTYQAEHGLVQPPELPRTCLADLGGALEAVIAALELVIAGQAGAPGRRIAVSLSASAKWFAAPLARGITSPGGQLGGGFAGYGIYQTRQGWIAVAALEPHFQNALARELGVAKLEAEVLQQAFLKRTADEWLERALKSDLPIVKVIE